MAVRIVAGPAGEMAEVDSTDHVEALALAELAGEIGACLAAGHAPPTGALLGLPELPGDVWCDIAGASAVTGFPAKTITSWLSRGGPRKCPFPPARRYLYRLHWPMSELAAWRDDYDSGER